MLVRQAAVAAAAPLAILLVAACGADADTSADVRDASGSASTIRVTSTAFADGDLIPAENTCDGAGDVPPLEWAGLPDKARAVAVVVDDPDAPGGTFVHWLVFDLPVNDTSLTASDEPLSALNSAGDTGWTPPCPPSGTHHYRFTVYALSAPIGLADGVELEAALDAIGRLSIAQGRLTGTYAG